MFVCLILVSIACNNALVYIFRAAWMLMNCMYECRCIVLSINAVVFSQYAYATDLGLMLKVSGSVCHNGYHDNHFIRMWNLFKESEFIRQVVYCVSLCS